MTKKKLTAAICALLVGCSFSAEAAVPSDTAAQTANSTQAESVTNENIRSVTSIATVFGDGEKVDAIALEYPTKIDSASVTPDDYEVEGKEIASVYTNDKPMQSEELVTTSKPGKYVILKLKYVNEQEQKLLEQQKNAQSKPDKGVSPRMGDAPHMSDRAMPDLSVKVKQVGIVRDVKGRFYAPSEGVATTTRTTENDLAGFKQYTYTEPETGYTMPYNLFLPNGYTPDKKYPLMVFIPDASANSNNVKMALVQGKGAVVWASPEEQAKHPCIVLAPEYTNDLINSIGMMTTDDNVWTPGLTLMTHLIQNVIGSYSVDTNRIYGTGQSQGGMSNIAISDKYPDLFAAQYLVACQWNTKEMEVLKDKNLWIVVSEGDTKAYPGMNDATARWEKLGAKVARDKNMWNPKSTPQEFDDLVSHMAGKGANINYTVLKGGNHNYTWTVAYDIEGIRDWLFLQSKDNAPVIPNDKEITGYNKRVTASEMLSKGKNFYAEANYDYAMQYFKEADRLGHFKAARYIGQMYEKGQGVKKDYKEAVRWYTKAMAAGDITSTYYLGRMYEDGLGVKQDYAKAMQYYAKSAERGDIIAAPGMVAEARLFEKGLGVTKDEAKAQELYAQAKATGYEFDE